jgi:hypothetical protein
VKIWRASDKSELAEIGQACATRIKPAFLKSKQLSSIADAERA